MPRPRIPRMVLAEPNITYFKPVGIPMNRLEQVILTIDEFEAVRLKDYEGLDQINAAKRMKISQPTFQRLLLSARGKIADALSNGKAIRIEGGHYRMSNRGLGRGLGKNMVPGRLRRGRRFAQI